MYSSMLVSCIYHVVSCIHQCWYHVSIKVGIMYSCIHINVGICIYQCWYHVSINVGTMYSSMLVSCIHQCGIMYSSMWVVVFTFNIVTSFPIFLSIQERRTYSIKYKSGQWTLSGMGRWRLLTSFSPHTSSRSLPIFFNAASNSSSSVEHTHTHTHTLTHNGAHTHILTQCMPATQKHVHTHLCLFIHCGHGPLKRASSFT
jgi:hypothetical protein